MTRTIPDKKRRQHYVWRHYLDGWAANGKIWCRRGDKVFSAGTRNVALERDFYHLREMSEYDLAMVRQLLIEPLASPLRELAEGWIPHFTEVFRIKRLYDASGQSSPELEAALDVSIHNLEEDMHARLETRALPLLAALRRGDASILDDDEDSIFHTWFIAAQYFRTPRMLMNAIGALKGMASFNIEASFGLMRTIMSTNVGHALWARRSGLRSTFLRADAGATFVTGDQPIVNARAVGLLPGEESNRLELYYPLMPDLAVLFDFDAGVKQIEGRTATSEEVATYNRMIVERSCEQIYGLSQDAVQHALKNVQR